MALNQIFKLNIPFKRLMKLGGSLGSDVVFFLSNKKFAFGYSRGEKLKFINYPSKIKLWHIIIAPKNKYLTKDMYGKYDKFLKLTKKTLDDKIKCSIKTKITSLVIKKSLFNSFEHVAEPLISQIKQRLAQINVKYTLMSGSGSAVFGIVETRKEAEGLARYLKSIKLGQIFVVKTY